MNGFGTRAIAFRGSLGGFCCAAMLLLAGFFSAALDFAYGFCQQWLFDARSTIGRRVSCCAGSNRELGRLGGWCDVRWFRGLLSVF